VVIDEGVMVHEAEEIIIEVEEYFEKLKGTHLPDWAKLEHIVSVSKYFTPGVPEGVHLKCKVSVNFYSAPSVYSLCIGLAEHDGIGKMNKYYVYDSAMGITKATPNKPSQQDVFLLSLCSKTQKYAAA